MAEVQLVQLEHAIMINKGISVRRHNSNAVNIIDDILDDRQ
jgi:hypothetical protein